MLGSLYAFPHMVCELAVRLITAQSTGGDFYKNGYTEGSRYES